VTDLFLVRHADAGDPMAWPGPDDLRPLSDKGRRQATRLGRHLASIGAQVDAVISSPRIRALQTAEIVAEALGLRVTVDRRLAEPLDPEIVEAIVADAGAPARPMLVGHDPDITDLVVALTGGTNLTMRKGALARLQVEAPFVDGRAALRWLIPPDLLPR
jgi:phosphohistidine phosphatase